MEIVNAKNHTAVSQIQLVKVSLLVDQIFSWCWLQPPAIVSICGTSLQTTGVLNTELRNKMVISEVHMSLALNKYP